MIPMIARSTVWAGAAAAGIAVGAALASAPDASAAPNSSPAGTSSSQASGPAASARPATGPQPRAARNSGPVRPAATVRGQRRSEAAAPTQPIGQLVSPLGTPAQIAAEKEAARITRTLPVIAMKGVLGLAWKITAAHQFALVGGPDKANLAALGEAVDEWAMASAFQQQILDSNNPRIVKQVAPPHQWYGQDVTGSRILFDNPDTIYRFTGVNYASQYVITGHLPTNDPQASFSVLTGTTGTTAAVLNASDLELSSDRSFVLTVSSAPAAPGQKNHIQLTPDTTLIAIRDTLADWSAEDPMGLAIQRTAGPRDSLFSQLGGFAFPGIGPAVSKSPALTALVSLVPPLPVEPQFVRGLITAALMIRGISQESLYMGVATNDPSTGERKPPNVFTDPTRNASFLSTQLQSAGYFQLTDEQALVLTITPNKAGYFGVPVTNDWTITDDYWNQQTSLNSDQARSNPDGTYTIVVSPKQPQLAADTSVWNWVSTGGLNQGTIAIRFQQLDPDNPDNPKVSSQVVSLADLGTVLPDGTVYVAPVERLAQLSTRKTGFDRRFAPYPQPATG